MFPLRRASTMTLFRNILLAFTCWIVPLDATAITHPTSTSIGSGLGSMSGTTPSTGPAVGTVLSSGSVGARSSGAAVSLRSGMMQERPTPNSTVAPSFSEVDIGGILTQQIAKERAVLLGVLRLVNTSKVTARIEGVTLVAQRLSLSKLRAGGVHRTVVELEG
eukprot:UN27618